MTAAKSAPVATRTLLREVALGSYVTVMYRGEAFRLQVTARYPEIIWCRWRGPSGWTEGPLPMSPALELIGAVMTAEEAAR